ncbi:ATP-dependent DNA helicase, partial [Hanseniaspora valbyensis NRRL Y-1626]
RHPWSDELEDNLQSKFKLNSFRSNQLDAINATLKGQDVFVLMPTGGGKSLCYQLPATVKQGRSQTTLVISPLISLMQDQVDHLRALRINAAMISSKDSAASRRESFQIESFQMFRDGALDLIYLSPEMINKSAQCRNTIKRLYENDKLARIVIDEAHCVSSWGHDFRPDYKQLNFFKKEYPDIPMMALTATASMKVRTDILNNLGLNNAILFKQSFNRPNLVYMVRPKNKNSMFGMITEIKNRFFYNTGIVYCNSKKQCEDTSKLLEANGLSCSFYHAGMLNEDRSEVQIKWQSGEIKIVCATVAFGMGIDKPDVRFVYHHTMPRSLEGYYQECGRAGRDGKTAFCAMYYQYADFKSLESQIKKDKSLTNEELKQRHLEKLHEVLNYCSNTIECRRKLVLQYFNENFDVKLCKKTCDNCKASNIVEHKDITEDATYLLNIVEKIGLEDLTSNYIIDVYRGSRQQKIVNNGHALLEEHGKGSKYLKEDVQRMIQLLLDKGYLREKIGTNGFGFTNTYVKFNKKLRSQLTMTFSASKSPSSTPTASRPSSLAPYGGASSRRTGTSMRMINDVLSKNVDINQEGLKEFQQKKKALIKTQQKSNGRKRQSNRGYKRSRRRI